MIQLLRYTSQLLLYGAFIVTIGYASTAPTHTHIGDNKAVIKLTLKHAGQRLEACRQLSEEEQARLAPNMRVKEVCPRERSPVKLELLIDGELMYSATLTPGGLSRDGNSNTYQRFVVPAGKHALLARLNDDVHVKGFNYEKEQDITLSPLQIFVIDFRTDSDGFIFN
ncbi:MAG TPA: hypothetical protein ENI64_00745 [Gammaproteobacteria bacterium]|nr:hypothetical protein [Gammaproteobacteria bacterium]